MAGSLVSWEETGGMLSDATQPKGRKELGQEGWFQLWDNDFSLMSLLMSCGTRSLVTVIRSEEKGQSILLCPFTEKDS